MKRLLLKVTMVMATDCDEAMTPKGPKIRVAMGKTPEVLRRIGIGMKKLTPRTVALSLEYHLFKKDKALLRALVPAKVQGMLAPPRAGKVLGLGCQTLQRMDAPASGARRVNMRLNSSPACSLSQLRFGMAARLHI